MRDLGKHLAGFGAPCLYLGTLGTFCFLLASWQLEKEKVVGGSAPLASLAPGLKNLCGSGPPQLSASLQAGVPS